MREEVALRSAVRPALLHFAQATSTRRSPRCWSWRRCRAISRPCCAARSRCCCATTTSISPTGRTPATCRVDAGAFGVDEYVDYLIRFLEEIGPGAHVLAVCQPCVQALAAVAVMSEQENPATPRSDDADGGSDRRARKPDGGERAGRGKAAVVVQGQRDLHRAGALSGRRAAGLSRLHAAHRLPHDEHGPAPGAAPEDVQAPRRRTKRPRPRRSRSSTTSISPCSTSPRNSTSRPSTGCSSGPNSPPAISAIAARRSDPGAIRKTALLTVEGGRDDICALGQTAAAHDLCTSLRPHLKRHHLQANVGHYGVFNGRRWENEIYPVVRNMILAME